MADEKNAGAASEFTLVGVYLQLDDLDRLLSDEIISRPMRMAKATVQVRAMKSDLRKRVGEAIAAMGLPVKQEPT